ncbi:MAG: phosphatase PAP2 family protein [Candidatus Pacearchaeota archaeon]
MKRAKWLILAGILMIIFFAFDYSLLSFLDAIKFSSLDRFFSILLFIQKEPYFEIWLVCFMFFLMLLKKEKKNFPKFLIAFVLAAIVNLALKNIIARPRPIEGTNSFPSGHATLLFTTIPFLEQKTIKISWTIFVFLLVFTRVYFKIHFFSDVAGAFIIGYGFALLAKKIKWKKA